MKVAILTFQFAHNYGALLQAYALKKYIEREKLEAEVTPYYPEWAQAEYAISPFTKGVPPRRRIRLAVQYFRRKRQSAIFERFISGDLGAGNTFSSEQELVGWLDCHNLVVCGSDQIWNSNITGKGGAYFAAGSKAKKVSYAASLGTITITSEQRYDILQYLPDFAAISVREPSSAINIESLIHKETQVVLDPVFLLEPDEWKKVEEPINVESQYMFLYFLQEDNQLLTFAQMYANQHGLKIYDVHPTMAVKHEGCTRLDNVGPKEFLWLIHNAECVCTNSFHATAFSVIFQKKLIHIPNSNSPERTVSLLKRIGVELKENNEIPLYDLKQCDRGKLEIEIKKSKKFLIDAL